MLNQQPTGGRNGVHLAIDASGRHLVLANYATGTVALLPIGQDGSLGARSDLVTLTGTPGPHKTQQESSAGAAPRHADFHPALPYVYVINELDSTIAVYRIDPDKGILEPLQVHTTMPSRYTGNNTGAEIAVAPSGRFLYGSNRGHDSIAIFSIDQSTGLLTSVGWEPTQGRTPRFFALDPPGAHLYAANQASDTVVIFRVDQTTGKLTPTGETIDVKTPVTIAFR